VAIRCPKIGLTHDGQQSAQRPGSGLGIKPTVQAKEREYYRCNTCGDVLTDETAIFDVEGENTPYCSECFYVFLHGFFYGPYDTGYHEQHPTPKQRICLDCKKCCEGCYDLDSVIPFSAALLQGL
jgi:hypothetical protein